MRKILSILLICVLIIGGSFSVYAQTTAITNEAQIRPDFTIVIDNKECGFKNVNNQYVYPVLYEGSTYLPLRAIAEVMGKRVNWDEAKKTITISGKNATQLTGKSTDTTVTKENIKVQVRQDFTIIIDSKECNFKDANGKTTYPILYNGSTYLPLRAIGEIMGKTVTWDNANKTVYLVGSSLTVTDADSFENTTNTETQKPVDTNKPNTDSNITDDKTDKIISKDDAIEIVLKKVPGATAKQIKIKLDKDDDDDEIVYEGSLFYDDKEYEFELDAKTGKILEWEIDD